MSDESEIDKAFRELEEAVNDFKREFLKVTRIDKAVIWLDLKLNKVYNYVTNKSKRRREKRR